MRIFSIILLILLTSNLWAVFCPSCGMENDDSYHFCYHCGYPISKVKKSSAKTPAPSQNHNYNQIKSSSQSPFASFSSIKANSTQGMDPKAFSNALQGMLGSGAAQQLMGLQGQNINANQLQELNNNPQVKGLVEMMKSPQFQKQLMEGLKMFQGYNQQNHGQSQNNNLNQSMQQLDGLFKMLNTQGTSGSQP